MLTTRTIPNVEILSAGRWSGSGCPPGGCVFTDDDLDAFVTSYRADYQPPVKLGHDDDQKLLQSDGLPAAGWLSNLRTEVVDGTKKLLADIVKVPEKIAALMAAGAYKNRSVEIHGNQITALALLGGDLPAVENLSDIMAWYSKQFTAADDDDKLIVFNRPAPKTCCAASKNPHWQAGRDPHDQTCENFDGAHSRTLTTYADNGEQVLTNLTSFIQRTGDLVSLRAERGKSLNETNRARLASLRDGLRDAESKLGAFLEDTEDHDPPPVQQDYTRVMRARLRAAELRRGELIGA